MSRGLIRGLIVVCAGCSAPAQELEPSRAEELLTHVTESFGYIAVQFEEQKFSFARIPVGEDDFAYQEERAREILEDTRDAAVGTLEASELEPLAEFVGSEFDEFQRRLERDRRCLNCVSRRSWELIVERVSRLLALLRGLESLVVDILARSEPPEVRVTLWIRNHLEPERETWTEDVLENVYRGRYLVRAEKDLYQPAELPINLLAERGALSCTLVPLDSAESSRCRLVNE